MTNVYLMTGAQSRMARSLLKWSREKLAEEANVARGTIRIFEDDQPIRESIIRDIQGVFDANGVECTPDGSVKPRTDGIKDFRGLGGCDRFFANIEKMLKDKAVGMVCRIGNQNMLTKVTGRNGLTNFDRLQKLSKVASVKCLLTDQNIYLPGPPSFEVRMNHEPPINLISSDFAYGEEVTFAIEQDNHFKFHHPVYMVIESPKLTKTAFECFEKRWQVAKPYKTSTSKRSGSNFDHQAMVPEGIETTRQLASCY